MPERPNVKLETVQRKSPGISVVIRTRDSSRTLLQVLDQLHLDSLDELIVVDSGSKDSTLSIAESFGAKIIHVAPPFNYSTSLNRGFEEARNEWVLVLSSHTIPLASDVLCTLRHFASVAPQDIVVAYGLSVLVKPTDTNPEPTQLYERIPISTTSCRAGNTFALYRKRTWLEHPFIERLTTAEDLEWFMWAVGKGYAGATIARAVALYRNQGSGLHMFRKGWKEVHQARFLGVRDNPTKFAIMLSYIRGVGYFIKLWIYNSLPFSSMLRQQSHHLGASLAQLLVRS